MKRTRLLQAPAATATAVVLAALAGSSCKRTEKGEPQARATSSISAGPAESARPPEVPPLTLEPTMPPSQSLRRDQVARTFQFDAAEDKPALKIDEHLERTVRILSGDTRSVQGIEIAVAEATTTTTLGSAAPRTVTDPRQGRKFRIQSKLGEARVTDESGTPVPANLATQIIGDHVELGLPFPLFSALPQGPIEPGERLDLSHDSVLALFPVDADGDFDVTRLALEFVASQRQEATFRAATRFWGTHDKRRIELDLVGQLVVRKPEAWPTRIELEGPAKLLAATGDATATPQTGRARIKITSKYESPGPVPSPSARNR